MDNQTDAAQSYSTGCETTFVDRIEVYDSGGHLLLSEEEETRQKRCADGKQPTEPHACSRNIIISVPPHTVRVVDFGDINDGYALSPGTYLVTPARVNRQSCALLRITLAQALTAEPHDAIMVTIPAQ